MKICIHVAIAAALSFAWLSPTLAQTPPPGLPVQEFNSINDLRSNSVGADGVFSAHVAAYYCTSGSCPPVTPDGGEGLFVASGTCSNGTGSAPSKDDGGSLIVDSYTGGPSHTGTCWYRQNINGDLRQFGVTFGSNYDCKHANILTCLPVDVTDTNHPAGAGLLQNASAAAKAAGLRRLTISGIQIYLSGAFSLDASMTLDGGVGSPDVSNHTIDSPGTIWTTDTANVTALTLGSSAVLQNAALMPHWIGQKLYDWGTNPDGVTYLDQQQILSHMVNTGQTGVTCTNQNCGIVNAVVAGYDTAVEASGPGTLLDEVSADGDACIYFHDSGAATHWRNVSCHPGATSDGVGEEYFTVTGVADDGSGKCKLTLNATSGAPFSDIDTRYYAWVSGLTAATGANANGRWKPLSVDTVNGIVVLDHSACAAATGIPTRLDGPTATASYTAGTQTVQLASATLTTDIANIKAGQTVIGTGIPGSTVVQTVSNSTGCIAPATGTCILVGISNAVTSTQTSASVTFSSLSYSGLLPDCAINGDEGSIGHCLMLTSQERIDAGASGGGLAAGGAGCATAFLIGSFKVVTPTYACQTGMGASGKTSGFDLLSPFCYAYAICYHLANAYSTRLISAGMDATRNLSDDNTAFGIVDGSFKGVSFVGGKAAKVGSGLVINPSGTDKGCVTVSSQNIGAFEVDQGCLLANGVEIAGNLIVSDNALMVQVSGHAPNLNIYKQDATAAHLASAITDTSGALQTKLGSTWWGGQFTPGGFPPRVAGTGGSGPTYVNGNDTVGRFTLASTGTFAPVVTFSHAWTNAPVCRVSDETSSGAPLSGVATVNTLNITGGLTAGHTIAYTCTGYSN